MTTPFDRNSIIKTTITYDNLASFYGYLDGLLGDLNPDGPFGELTTISSCVWNSASEDLTVSFEHLADTANLWKWSCTHVIINSVTYNLAWDEDEKYMAENITVNPFGGASGTTEISFGGFVKRDPKSEHGLSAPLFEVTGV